MKLEEGSGEREREGEEESLATLNAVSAVNEKRTVYRRSIVRWAPPKHCATVLFAEKFKPCLRDHRLSRGIKPIHLGIWGKVKHRWLAVFVRSVVKNQLFQPSMCSFLRQFSVMSALGVGLSRFL